MSKKIKILLTAIFSALIGITLVSCKETIDNQKNNKQPIQNEGKTNGETGKTTPTPSDKEDDKKKTDHKETDQADSGDAKHNENGSKDNEPNTETKTKEYSNEKLGIKVNYDATKQNVLVVFSTKQNLEKLPRLHYWGFEENSEWSTRPNLEKQGEKPIYTHLISSNQKEDKLGFIITKDTDSKFTTDVLTTNEKLSSYFATFEVGSLKVIYITSDKADRQNNDLEGVGIYTEESLDDFIKYVEQKQETPENHNQGGGEQTNPNIDQPQGDQAQPDNNNSNKEEKKEEVAPLLKEYKIEGLEELNGTYDANKQNVLVVFYTNQNLGEITPKIHYWGFKKESEWKNKPDMEKKGSQPLYSYLITSNKKAEDTELGFIITKDAESKFTGDIKTSNEHLSKYFQDFKVGDLKVIFITSDKDQRQNDDLKDVGIYTGENTKEFISFLEKQNEQPTPPKDEINSENGAEKHEGEAVIPNNDGTTEEEKKEEEPKTKEVSVKGLENEKFIIDENKQNVLVVFSTKQELGQKLPKLHYWGFEKDSIWDQRPSFEKKGDKPVYTHLISSNKKQEAAELGFIVTSDTNSKFTGAIKTSGDKLSKYFENFNKGELKVIFITSDILKETRDDTDLDGVEVYTEENTEEFLKYLEKKSTESNPVDKDTIPQGDDPAVDGESEVVKPNPVETFTVTFELNGGKLDVSSKKVEKGQKVENPGEPKKDGYTFEKWVKTKDGEEEFNFETEVINDNTTIYAKYNRVLIKTQATNISEQDTWSPLVLSFDENVNVSKDPGTENIENPEILKSIKEKISYSRDLDYIKYENNDLKFYFKHENKPQNGEKIVISNELPLYQFNNGSYELIGSTNNQLELVYINDNFKNIITGQKNHTLQYKLKSYSDKDYYAYVAENAEVKDFKIENGLITVSYIYNQENESSLKIYKVLEEDKKNKPLSLEDQATAQLITTYHLGLYETQTYEDNKKVYTLQELEDIKVTLKEETNNILVVFATNKNLDNKLPKLHYWGFEEEIQWPTRPELTRMGDKQVYYRLISSNRKENTNLGFIITSNSESKFTGDIFTKPEIKEYLENLEKGALKVIFVTSEEDKDRKNEDLEGVNVYTGDNYQAFLEYINKKQQ